MKHRPRPLILIVHAALIVGWQTGYAASDEDRVASADSAANVSTSRRGADWDAIRARAMSWLREQAQASARNHGTRSSTHAQSSATPEPMARSDAAPVSAAQAQPPADTRLVPLRPEPEPETTARVPILHDSDTISSGPQDELARAAPAPPEPAPATHTDSDMPALPRKEHPAAFGNGTEVASADLDNLRGGFEAPTGQQFYFAITRTVYINGDLIATQTINLVNTALAGNPVTAPAVVAPVAPTSVTSAATSSTSQNTTPSTTAASSSTTTPATASSTGSSPTGSVVVSPGSNVSVTQGTSPSSSQATAVVVTPTAGPPGIPTTIVQNGTGNLADISSISQSASPLILQNTLNNQSIRTETTINATVPSLSIMGSINQMRAINEAIRNAATNR